MREKSIITEAQILHGLIKHATKLLGFLVARNAKVPKNVSKNVLKILSSFGESRKTNIQVTHMEIRISTVAPGTSRNQMVTTMSKLLCVSRKTLQRHIKFKFHIDENDESTCWALICKQLQRDRLLQGVRENLVEFWEIHSRVVSIRSIFCDGAYIEVCMMNIVSIL